jgi:nucleotide-binding universal stress UspA family protein
MLEELNYSSILVPIDGSSQSYEAIKYASKISRVFEDCSIMILYVMNKENIERISFHQREKVDSLYTKFLEQGERYCTRAIREAIKCGCSDYNLDSTIIYGNPVDEIIKMAANHDLTIIGLREKELFSDEIIANMTERVANSSKKPVLVIP